MLSIGSAVASSVGLAVFLFSAESITAVGGLIVAISGLAVGFMPYFMGRQKAREERYRDERKLAEARNMIAAQLRLSRAKNARVVGNTAKIEKTEDVILALVDSLRQKEGEMVRVLAIDRNWMRAVHKEFGVPLPEDFGMRIFDNQHAMDLDDLHAYLTGETTAPPAVVREAKNRVSRSSEEILLPTENEGTQDMPKAPDLA